MGEVVGLKPVSLVEDHGFIVDLARFRRIYWTKRRLRKKYRLANDVWEKLGEDDILIRKVEEESVRRQGTGHRKEKKHSCWSWPHPMSRPA